MWIDIAAAVGKNECRSKKEKQISRKGIRDAKSAPRSRDDSEGVKRRPKKKEGL
jgi:hypothetical protein